MLGTALTTSQALETLLSSWTFEMTSTHSRVLGAAYCNLSNYFHQVEMLALTIVQ